MGDIDTTEIGVSAAKLMEKLAEDFPDGSTVRTVFCLVEVEMPVEADEDDDYPFTSVLDWWCSEPRRIVQAGMLGLASDLIKSTWYDAGDDALEDEDE